MARTRVDELDAQGMRTGSQINSVRGEAKEVPARLELKEIFRSRGITFRIADCGSNRPAIFTQGNLWIMEAGSSVA
jgi:hypothetical protein